ncbi:hypothetical protein DERF_004178 [Dermatophagoides farinae]|uniref:Uncharacterized protein n=1 Tax=Dermatophagoides farinae TaxID=6954 RepID=A0A922I5I2_DERFA|nr:hypothetical protein DERF_004178 [Dermatophagoides farinae]
MNLYFQTQQQQQKNDKISIAINKEIIGKETRCPIYINEMCLRVCLYPIHVIQNEELKLKNILVAFGQEKKKIQTL